MYGIFPYIYHRNQLNACLLREILDFHEKMLEFF